MPCGPCGPWYPSGPFGPLGPVTPVAPLGPSGPVGPCGPSAPTSPSGPRKPLGPWAPGVPLRPTRMTMSTGIFDCSSFSSSFSCASASSSSLRRLTTTPSSVLDFMQGQPAHGPKKTFSPTWSSIVAALTLNSAPWLLQSQLHFSSPCSDSLAFANVDENFLLKMSFALRSSATSLSRLFRPALSRERSPKPTRTLVFGVLLMYAA
mmetsp:Transcript_35656/g.71461  ORF Transcript_35656/g.71461 Transcript_35656/m.71461 type:complete len:206 (+) Transcript_35656:3-620(+)